MAVKFLEITEDPFTNQSNLFILILGIAFFGLPNPTGTGSYTTLTGALIDPGGNTVTHYSQLGTQDFEVTGTLSDEAFAHSFTVKNIVAIPPGWVFKDFTYAYGVQGTLEELAPFIRGM